MARYQRLRQPVFINPLSNVLAASRTRLNDDLLDVAYAMSNRLRVPAFHEGVMPIVTAFADPALVKPTWLTPIAGQ